MMLEVLKFIFSSFWVWLGSCILLLCFTSAFVSMLSFVLGAARGVNSCHCHDHEVPSSHHRPEDGQRAGLSAKSN